MRRVSARGSELIFTEQSMPNNQWKLSRWENQGRWHPLLAARDYGAGRGVCWMTGASPHWGINFMKWRSYQQFWEQVFRA
jgi:uncharacterized membrane protein